MGLMGENKADKEVTDQKAGLLNEGNPPIKESTKEHRR